MKLRKILATLAAAVMLGTLPVLSLAETGYGSAAVTAGQTYTVEQMLTYAIQDEYAAQAEYQAILAAYGDNNAFANIVKAENTHIALLTTLFDTYGLTLPANDAASKITLPASLEEAYAAGVTAENANIAMYQTFLAQSDLPADVSATFTSLENASQNHLTAFTRNTENAGNGMMRNGRGNTWDSDDDATTGNGRNQQNNNGCGENCTVNGGATQNNTSCPCGTNNTGCGMGGRGGRQRNSANGT